MMVFDENGPPPLPGGAVSGCLPGASQNRKARAAPTTMASVSTAIAHSPTTPTTSGGQPRDRQKAEDELRELLPQKRGLAADLPRLVSAHPVEGVPEHHEANGRI